MTVLLTTNAAFITAQRLETLASHNTIAVIASYASTVLSLGSYLIWWILSLRHPAETMSTASDAVCSRLIEHLNDILTQIM